MTVSGGISSTRTIGGSIGGSTGSGAGDSDLKRRVEELENKIAGLENKITYGSEPMEDGVTPLGDGDIYVQYGNVPEVVGGITQEQADELYAPKVREGNAVLRSSAWSNSVPYTQSVSVDFVTADSRPVVDIEVSDNVSAGIEQVKQWGYITKAIAENGRIVFYCYEDKPTVDLTVRVKDV